MVTVSVISGWLFYNSHSALFLYYFIFKGLNRKCRKHAFPLQMSSSKAISCVRCENGLQMWAGHHTSASSTGRGNHKLMTQISDYQRIFLNSGSPASHSKKLTQKNIFVKPQKPVKCCQVILKCAKGQGNLKRLRPSHIVYDNKTI